MILNNSNIEMWMVLTHTFEVTLYTPMQMFDGVRLRIECQLFRCAYMYS